LGVLLTFGAGVLNWERGSLDDPIRNKFVIPFVAQYLNKEGIASIVDIGAATGHLSREIERRMLHDLSWTLVDRDRERLNYAMANKLDSMVMDTVCGDIGKEGLIDRCFGAVLVSFSLLELGTSKSVIEKLCLLCSSEGSLILIVPDVWQDVFAQSVADGSIEIVSRFIDSPVSLEKVDRFTSKKYPFLADRFERIIICVMQHGFTLEVFAEHYLNSKRVYGLIFKKQKIDG